MHARCCDDTATPIPPIPPSVNTLKKIFSVVVSSEFRVEKASRQSIEVKEKPLWWPSEVCFETRGGVIAVKKGAGYIQSEILALLKGILTYYRTRERERFEKYKTIILSHTPLSLAKPCCNKHNNHEGYKVWVEDLVHGSTPSTLASEVGYGICMSVSRLLIIAVCQVRGLFLTTCRYMTQENATRDVAEVLMELSSTSQTIEEAPPAPPPILVAEEVEPQPLEPVRKSQRVRKPSAKVAESTSNLQRVYVPHHSDRSTAFYPTLPWHFSCLRAIFLPMFKGKVLGDLCCGADDSLRCEYEKFTPQRIIMRDANYGTTRFNALEEPLPAVDILVTSLPYSKGVCTPLLLRLVNAYPLVFVKLQLCFDRCASSDTRDEIMMGGTLAWEVRLSPSKYPTFTKDNPAIESWFVFARTQELAQELDACVECFFEKLAPREGSSVEYAFTCDIGESSIVSVRRRTKLIKWDMRDALRKKQLATPGGHI